MFPNDDICNVDAARQAAKRLFRRYRDREDNEQPFMGKQEVNRLMKSAYDAINMRTCDVIQRTTPMKKIYLASSVFSTAIMMEKLN
jgi:hypothetical protein